MKKSFRNLAMSLVAAAVMTGCGTEGNKTGEPYSRY